MPRAKELPWTMDQREAALQAEIRRLQSQGWHVQAMTGSMAQLVRDRNMNGCLFLILLCFGILPGILYAIVAKGSQSLLIEVDEWGRMRRTKGR